MNQASRVTLDSAYWFQEGPGVRNWQFTTSGIKLLNVANITKVGELDLNKTRRHLSVDEVQEKYAHFLVDAGDLVIASSGISFDTDGLLRTRGAFVHKSDLPLCLNTSTIRFKAKHGISDLRFLKFWLDSDEFRRQITRRVTGSAQQNFGPSHLRTLEISLPSLAQQQRIAGLLERADRLRRVRRYVRQLSNVLIKSVFLKMFGDPRTNPMGWDLSLIDEVLAISQYGTSEKSNSERRGYPVLGMANITSDGRIDLSSLSHVELSRSEFGRLRLESGDIIFNRTNSTELVGKTACWRRPLEAVIASYLVRLRLKSGVVPEFFAALLNTNYYKRLFQQRCKKAVGQSNISPTLLREFVIYVPPLHLQRRFADLIDGFERLEAQQREAERQAEQLFQSLLNRAFATEQ